MKRFSKRWAKPLLLVLLAVSVFFLNRRYGWTNGDFFAAVQEAAREHYWKASLLYVLATAIGCVLLALPGVTFALCAGMLFGPVAGTILCLAATTAGASAAFLAGRWFLKDAVKPMIEKNRYLKKILFDDVDKSGMVLLMITRLLPFFPYNLQNFAYGVTNIGFWPYTFYTFVFMFPGVAFFTIGAAAFTAGERREVHFLVAGALALGVTALGLFLYRRYFAEAETSRSNSLSFKRYEKEEIEQ